MTIQGWTYLLVGITFSMYIGILNIINGIDCQKVFFWFMFSGLNFSPLYLKTAMNFPDYLIGR